MFETAILRLNIIRMEAGLPITEFLRVIDGRRVLVAKSLHGLDRRKPFVKDKEAALRYTHVEGRPECTQQRPQYIYQEHRVETPHRDGHVLPDFREAAPGLH